MTTEFKRLKYCDKRSRYLTNGYIREIQRCFNWKENSSYTISDLIIHLCLSFYFDGGVFNQDKHGDNIRFVNEKTIEKLPSEGAANSAQCSIGTAISNEMCDVFIIEYLINGKSEFCPFLGYFEGESFPTDMDWNTCNFYHDARFICLGVVNYWKYLDVYQGGYVPIHKIDLNEYPSVGDKYKMEFNFVQSKVYIYQNDKKFNQSIDLKSTHICPLIAMYKPGAKVTIVKYEFIAINE